MKRYLIFLFLLTFFTSYAQENSFPFGKSTYVDFKTTIYNADTSAAAVVLKEFGEAYIESDRNFNLILDYHVKIKILKKAGLEMANYEIPLQIHKQDGRRESLRFVKASTFNIESGGIVETQLLDKNVFIENRNKYWDIKKFALPNARVGSVIEIQYQIESPFIYNFRSWEFQSSIPKISSEYWATIPANYRYNIALRGFLELDKNESKILKEYFTPNGEKSDCVRYMWRMDSIPAFVDEDYMTARSNFVSAINFELAQIEYFDGRKDKITKEWKDAEDELRKEERFGLQIKRGKDIMDDHVVSIVGNETDSLIKAQKIYTFVKDWFRWNDGYGKYSELGIKKAFQEKTGNVGDINLSLIAALKYAGLHTEPMILSTRDNGQATELYPVLSEFNYVVAKVNINGKSYLLDATDDFHPFGLLPERCLNGKGRVLGEKASYWYDIKPSGRAKQISTLTLKLDEDGLMRGTISTMYMGYKAVEQRKKIYTYTDQKEYIKEAASKMNKMAIKNFTLENVDDFNRPLIEKLDVEIETEGASDNFLFNPFIVERWRNNPFKSKERLYPVDFGAPLEEIIILDLTLPSYYESVDLPPKIGLALPDNGGRFMYTVQHTGSKLIMNNSLLINKTVFSSKEYHYLKALFNQVVEIHNTDLILKKKS